MPIVVTVFGIVTEVILCCSWVVLPYLENAFAAIEVTPSGITTAPAQVKSLLVTILFWMVNVPPPLHATLCGVLTLAEELELAPAPSIFEA